MNEYKYTKSPYTNIPEDLLNKYTMDNKIDVLNWWFDSSGDLTINTWDDAYIDKFKNAFTVQNINNNTFGWEPYPGAATNLMKAFINYNIHNMNVAVIGSLHPWIEGMLLNLNNTVTTVEYNVPIIKTNQLTAISYWDFQKTNKLYDCIVTYSSVEHSGLGRYGDPLDPDGDIKTMNDIYNNLKQDGILIWGAPVGKDALVWNAHRIYGSIRLPLMFNNFKELEWINCDKDLFINAPLEKSRHQPVIVLQKRTILE